MCLESSKFHDIREMARHKIKSLKTLKQILENSIKKICQKWEGETISKRFFFFKQLKSCIKILPVQYNFHSFLETCTLYFINDTFFKSGSVLFIFFINWALNVVYKLLSTYQNYHNETLFIFTILVSLSRPRSLYVISVWSFFLFLFHFHYD